LVVVMTMVVVEMALVVEMVVDRALVVLVPY
jgi:hypothetical protein